MRTNARPRIAPITSNDRPLWSVMVPTYQCSRYLGQALESVLEQALPPELMQIDVVDDCSDDDPEAVVRGLANGRVGFHRQPRNVGIAANLTTCVERARGTLVHLLHGDDAVLPGFYEAYGAYFDTNPHVLMGFASVIVIDERGQRGRVRGDMGEARVFADALEMLIGDNPVVAPSVVTRRVAFEAVGGFNRALSHTADWEMWMRIAAHGPIGYLGGPHLLYREHPASDSNRSIIEGRNIDEYVGATNRGIKLLPPKRRRPLRRAARRKYAGLAEYYRCELHSRGEHRAALRHAVREARLNPFGRSPLRLLSSALRAFRLKSLVAVVYRR